MIDNPILFLVILPELLQVIFINALLVFAMVFSLVTKEENRKADFSVIMPTLLIEVMVQLMALGLVTSAILYWNSVLSYTLSFGLISDNFGKFMSLFVCFSAISVLGLGMHALKRVSRYEFIFLLWLSIIGMLSLIKSYSFLAFYLSIELQSLSFYMLAAMRSRTEASAEAGLKYFILSAFSSSMLLLGIVLIYGAVGSQTFDDLDMVLNHFSLISSTHQIGLYVGLGCISISLLFKLGAAPFHAWIADVYEGSHISITAWFAITAKIAVVTALIRINTPNTLVVLLTAVGVISLLVGSLGALRQGKLKRLMAFSAVANAGWFLLAFSAGQWKFTIIHLIVYTLLSINLFSVFSLTLFRTHPSLAYRIRILKAPSNEVDHGADSSTIKYISDLNQLYKNNYSLALAVTISLFSLAGIPPFSGFYSKYLIINAVVQSEQYFVLVLALGAAVISAYYYVRIVKTIYFSLNKKTQHFTLYELPINANITSFTTAFTILFLIKPDYFCIWIS